MKCHPKSICLKSKNSKTSLRKAAPWGRGGFWGPGSNDTGVLGWRELTELTRSGHFSACMLRPIERERIPRGSTAGPRGGKVPGRLCMRRGFRGARRAGTVPGCGSPALVRKPLLHKTQAPAWVTAAVAALPPSRGSGAGVRPSASCPLDPVRTSVSGSTARSYNNVLSKQ